MDRPIFGKIRALIVIVSLISTATVTRSACADAVTEWNEIMQAVVGRSDPAVRGRSAVITQVAVFEAVNSIEGDYEPYTQQVTAPPVASPEAAVIASAHRVLIALHPDSAAELDRRRANALARLGDGRAKVDGIAVGVAAAEAILALRRDDGFERSDTFAPGTSPGEWRPTPPNFIPAFRPGLGNVKTFSTPSGRYFRSAPPPPLGSHAYTVAYNEVKARGGTRSTDRPQDRADVARFYAMTDDDGVWFPAARQIATAQRRTLAENARTFALIGIAVWDSAVACFETKYHYNLWRPVTAIKAGDDDRNPETEADPNWETYVETPPFPSYPSGHASIGGAARAVMEEVFGPSGHSITLTNPVLPQIVLRYSTFEQITDDIDDARVYGGVHFRFDQSAAGRQGRDVGRYVLRHHLRPKRSGS